MAKKNAAVVDANGFTNETFTPDMLPKNATKLPKPKVVAATAAPAVPAKGKKVSAPAVVTPIKQTTKPKAKATPAPTLVAIKGKASKAASPKVVAIVEAKGKRGRKAKELSHTLKDIQQFVKEGYSLAQIAEEVGVSIPTLYNRFPEIKGLIPRGRRAA